MSIQTRTIDYEDGDTVLEGLIAWDDPMSTPHSVVAPGEKLTALGADWQLHGYGNTLHAFTNPDANDPEFGTVYNASADRRSWLSMQNFLAELF
jgi:dienelactone hydrolase